MKKIGDLMAEMGFRKEAPESLKEAFLKHLIKNATGVEVETPSEKAQKLIRPPQPKPSLNQIETNKDEPKQLVFEFFHDQGKDKAKVS